MLPFFLLLLPIALAQQQYPEYKGAYHSDVKTYTDSHPVPNPVEAPRHKRNPLLTASIGPQPKPLAISEDTTTEKPKPKAFAYQYGGGEDNTKFEQQNVEGQVRGEYTVRLPDGRLQRVSYYADKQNGFQSEVEYEGSPYPVDSPYSGQGPAQDANRPIRKYPKHNYSPYKRIRNVKY